MTKYEEKRLKAIRFRCEQDHLFFTRYFFKVRQSIKFIVNWHHLLISDAIEGVINGKYENLIITVPPGSSKTEMVVINLIARGLAINPRARFLHLSGSDTLTSLNSATAREIVQSDEYQELWPLQIAEDAKAKKRWNVIVDEQTAGGVYATSLGGQITGFRAGHMTEGFQGAIIIDDPIKPDDAYSKTKLDAANRKLLTTVKSRKANPKTPIVIVMQRIAESDPVGFIEKGNLPGKWTKIKIPAVIDEKYVSRLAKKYQALVDDTIRDEHGRFSYWPYKEPLDQLLTMERGDGADSSGAKISRHVFSSQYQQAPKQLGGNIIKGEYFGRYKILPKLKYRMIYSDTAQKTKERNDYSVFGEVGLGVDGNLYVIDWIRGKWEAPELKKRAIAFWVKCKNRDVETYGSLRKMKVEDKSSGTGLIQSIKTPEVGEVRIIIPIEGIERNKDKLTRVMDFTPLLEAGCVWVPEDAPFTNDLIQECEAFTADDTHDFDDQVDVIVDAATDMLSPNNVVERFKRSMAKGSGNVEKISEV